ncbi:MAG: hypothetical protein WAW84_03535 [Candidatus Rickettsiella isopodorum]|jgi:hypothetical protein
MKIKKYLLTLMILVLFEAMTGCASDSLDAPCPHFGANCKKIPINSWDYQQ